VGGDREGGAEADFDLTDDELRRSGSLKWRYGDDDVLPAWVAEMDVRPCPTVSAALRDAVDRGDLGYPPLRVPELAEALAGFAAGRLGWAVDQGRVLPTGDVMAGTLLAIEVLCENAPVVVPVPSYPPFLDGIPLTGRPLVPVPCAAGPDGSPVLDLDAIGAAFAAGARTLVLTNPHNPLGRVFTPAELADLAALADRWGVRVISDEIHAPLVLPGARHVPYATTGDPRAVTLTAASKAFNIPGLKCAQIVTEAAADHAALAGLPGVANHGTSPLGIAATIAAYRDGGPWLDGVVAHLAAQRRRFGELLAEHLPLARWWPMQATYLAWVDAGPYGGDRPARQALKMGRVMVNDGETFGPGLGYERHVRVNLATSGERLTRVVQRLAHAWAP
jgi:cysteine-S-conjugate beta-lyase